MSTSYSFMAGVNFGVAITALIVAAPLWLVALNALGFVGGLYGTLYWLAREGK